MAIANTFIHPSTFPARCTMLLSHLPSMLATNGGGVKRRTLVLITLLAASANTLVVAVAMSDTLVRHLAATALAIYLVLVAMVWGLGAVKFAAHSLITCSFFLFAVLISETGGINSPAVMWMPILSIAALLMTNIRWAAVWMVLIVLHHVAQFVAAQKHWIPGQVDASIMSPATALWARVNVLAFILFALVMYDTISRRTKQSLELRNAELEALQAARRKAQSHIDGLILSLGQHLRAPVQKIAALQSLMPTTTAPTDGPSPQRITQLAQQIVELVNQVLDIARYETGRLVFNSAPLRVQDVIAQASGTPLQMQVPASLWIWGDRARLTQVVRYTLNQALMHAAGRPVQVIARMQDKGLQVRVYWHTSYQAPANEAAAPLGDDRWDKDGHQPRTQDWGHALCERLLRLAGAQLSPVRTENAASYIDLHWPAKWCDPPSAVGPAVPTAAKGSWRFLLIDDQPQRIEALQMMLRRHWPAAQISQSPGGESALLQLEFAPYDLVIMALHMQPMDGLETVRRMREHSKPQMQELAVIGVCDKEFSHQRQSCRDAGMQWLVFLPLQEHDLIPLITLHLPEVTQ